MDAGRSPTTAINQLAMALIITTKFLLKLDPATLIGPLAAIVTNYFLNTTKLRQRSADTYGVDLGQSEQITTPGIYVDSLIGRCSACESSIEASRYVEVMRQYEELKQIARMNQLADTEVERRKKLLEAGKLDPFEVQPQEEPQ
jgi:hypothetical protein